MHIQTHVMSGWCLGNLLNLTPRERLFCMLAASLPDLDGLGILAGQDAYWEYHHVVGHNLPAALLVAGILTFFSTNRRKAFGVYLGLFHLHLAMDYFGSGPGWPICYFWPFTRWEIVNWNAWNLYSWQNLLFGLAFLAWVIVIAIRKGRTPLEAIMPKLDVQLVEWLRRRLPGGDS
jgi:inner membrane protein